jgi:HK97 family phage portal protein
MTIWRRIAEVFGRRSGLLANPPSWLSDAFGAVPSTSGVVVTEQAALTCAAFYACVRVLADSVAQLPLKIQRVKDGGKVDDRAHPVWALLHDLPNPEMTAFEFKHLLQQHLAIYGNAYAEIERNQLGQPVALWPLNPTAMRVDRDLKTRNKLWLYTLPDGQVARFEWTQPTRRPSPILHLRGLGDSLAGYSPLKLLRDTIGRSLATSEYGSRLFANSAQPRGYLKVPHALAALTPEQKVKLKESWEAAHRGLANAHRVAILEHGLEWHQIGMNAEDAQFIETQKLNVTDVARAFRIPPHMIGDLERATFANIEHQAIEFVVHTLTPWLVCWEQAIARDLLSVKAFETHQVKFVVQGLLRGDIESRYRAYATGRQWGWLSANAVLALEDMNGIGPQGDVYLTPANMLDANAAIAAAAVPDAADPARALRRVS